MDDFQTEEQQVDAIKKFWHENGNSLIAGLVIGLGGFVGFNYYQESQIEAQEALSAEFQATMESFAAQEDNFRTNAQAFIDANKENSYSAFAAFALAKDASSHQNWAGAQTHLEQAANLASSDNMKAIAYLRLARVQIQQQAYDDALATLANPMPESYVASIEEIKGDAYLLQGNSEAARTAYQASADAGGLQTNPALQMKIDDLAVAVTAAN
ncbi:YfgM family protein [Thalassomonas sp. M1454]|uniref:YfgM family protein n=1 Tax=Thalassomonas sp. M1454 TaxID=2594477 RepID=UPI00117E22BD|nr:tetratricopeptide repeat protein [Thalassomonas sp. M1454]TRX53972.1 tetratricopeptide repeat protein [Thalassomonas sp. M1454]